jgi:hypothetical protein
MVQSIFLRQGIPRTSERGAMDWKPDFQIHLDGLMRSEVVMPPEKKGKLATGQMAAWTNLTTGPVNTHRSSGLRILLA